METYIATFIIFVLVIVALALGVIFGRHGIRGSCGGLASSDEFGKACEGCDKPCRKKKGAVDEL